MRFKNSCKYRRVKLCEKGADADAVASAALSNIFWNHVEEGNIPLISKGKYFSDHIFNKTSLYKKKLQSHTFVALEEIYVPCF